jgi:hypothetical protein
MQENPRLRASTNRAVWPNARTGWLGREGSNLRMGESKSPALPLGDAPIDLREPAEAGLAQIPSGHAGL